MLCIQNLKRFWVREKKKEEVPKERKATPMQMRDSYTFGMASLFIEIDRGIEIHAAANSVYKFVSQTDSKQQSTDDVR